MKNEILGYLLSIPNSNPHVLPISKDRFYLFKDEFLRKFCLSDDGFDLQIIKHTCWTCAVTGNYRFSSIYEDSCPRCKNGVYKTIYIVLARFYSGDRLFYKPISYSTIAPPKVRYKNTIEGYVKHDKSGKMAVIFTYLFLSLLTHRFLFWEAIGALIGIWKRRLRQKYDSLIKSIKGLFPLSCPDQDISKDNIPF